MMLSCRVPTARPFTATRPGLRTVPVAVRTQQGVAAPRPEVLVRVAEGTELAPGEIVAADDGEFDAVDDFGEDDFRGRAKDNKPNFKHFLPLPKPAHLVYIKPTVAVVAGKANRNSVGLRMTAQGSNLERYVIEYYARSVK